MSEKLSKYWISFNIKGKKTIISNLGDLPKEILEKIKDQRNWKLREIFVEKKEDNKIWGFVNEKTIRKIEGGIVFNAKFKEGDKEIFIPILKDGKGYNFLIMLEQRIHPYNLSHFPFAYDENTFIV